MSTFVFDMGGAAARPRHLTIPGASTSPHLITSDTVQSLREFRCGDVRVALEIYKDFRRLGEGSNGALIVLSTASGVKGIPRAS